MKEKFEKITDSFKTGIILWIFAYMILYVIGYFGNELEIYNTEIMKLLNLGNFLAQVSIAGCTYVILEVTLLHFANNMIEAAELEKNASQKLVKNFLIAFAILAVLLIGLYYVKENKIMSKYTLKIMMTLIALKAIVFVVTQAVKTSVYNKKLQEKINKDK